MSRSVGTVENGHVLTARFGWVRLNMQPPPGGPWQPGDVVGGNAFTGDQWTPLPGGWLPDPTGRHHLRWWTGQFWSQHAMSNGQPIHDPLIPQAGAQHMRSSWPATAPSASAQTALQTVGFLWSSVGRIATIIYCGTWFMVALYSLSIVLEENDPRWLALTATASGNVFAYKLNMTYSELKRRLRKDLQAKILYLAAGAVLARIVHGSAA